MTNDDDLAVKARMIANHGQSRLYYHDLIGVNSRLDAMQAVVLGVKLKHLDNYNLARDGAAMYYDAAFSQIQELTIPGRQPNSSHVFHQYTLRVAGDRRDALKAYLQEQGIPAMVYYPVPLYRQPAYNQYWNGPTEGLSVTESLCRSVISLPMHTELTEAILDRITGAVRAFFA
jgi:UDP-2-acetamido-2-deoxy-ribo-hexuluronate aminotransferase